jgi:1-acyl-sn-glycerol-3-phosphate acyltransferase
MSEKKENGVSLRDGDSIAYRRWHKALAKFILWLFRVRVRHADREPGAGETYLLCSNHISALDPVLIAAAVTKRQPHFMSKKELFRIPILRSIIRAFGAYPVDRAGDVAAIKTSVSLLEMGNCVGMFPQGTRCAGRVPRETTDKVKNGAGLLCDKTHVTVWPVCIKTKNNRLRAFRHQLARDRQNQPQRNERNVHRKKVYRVGHLLARHLAHVGAFEVDDALVGAQLPRQLTVADVDGIDLFGAVLEHAVGEAAGGSADVHGNLVF